MLWPALGLVETLAPRLDELARRCFIWIGWRQQRPAFQERFRPALQGLALASAGGARTDAEQRGRPDGARRFVGWTTEGHWLLARR